MSEIIISERMPVLALRGLTAFPKETLHFDVGREKSLKAVDTAMEGDRKLLLVPQKNIIHDEPTIGQLVSIGTVVTVKQVLKLPGELSRVLVEGEYRGVIRGILENESCMIARVESVPDDYADTTTAKCEALMRDCAAMFVDYLDMVQNNSAELRLRALAITEPGELADCVAQNSTIPYPGKCRLLTVTHPVRRLYEAYHLLQREVQVLHAENELQEKTRQNMDKNQRDYYLREQLRVIRNELGEGDEDDDTGSLKAKIHDLKLDEETEEKLLKDVDRLAKQPFGSSEAAVLRNYLDTVLALPWNKTTRERVDIEQARKILDADHFGLEKVKDRILDILAVKQMAPQLPGQIICLVGPPGVGKTSIAYSIARSLNRKMARISLGGVHDEADIRGHRKTYIGAMPGRIMTALQQAGSKNALLLLDEVDKMGADYRGDPSSALLEVLDSEQNATYRDHYLEIPFDLSGCMFITTANTLDTIPRPLLDRMEVIELGSYTDEEKLHIARDHLLPKQMKKHGLKKTQLRITEDALREIITCYTRESGVRTLERQIGAVCRKADRKLLSEDAPKRVTVTGKNLEEYLGIRRFHPDELPPSDSVGLVTGLAWTSVGGETLEVEVNVMEGTGRLELTGNLGDVMKESARAALSYIRSHAAELGVAPDFYKTRDIHVHFPEGAVPKDGPSAGVTVCTAMVSALTNTPVRRDIAMTGEISIRGRVLPIGGLKEKTMAALRHGIKTVIIPEANRRDLEEIDQTVRASLNFITARQVDAVLDAALVQEISAEVQLPEVPNPLPKKKPGRKPELRQ